MKAVRKIIHPKNKTVNIQVPESFVDHDVEIIILPSSEEKQKKSFSPSTYYGITNQPASEIREDAAQLRDEWERNQCI